MAIIPERANQEENTMKTGNLVKSSVLTITQMAMLCALSLVLVILVRFPIFPAAPFLVYDMADVPVLIGTILLGPIPGFALLVIVSVFQWLFLNPEGTWVGCVMHILASGMLVLPIGLITKKWKSTKPMLASFVVGFLLMITATIPLNLFFTVRFYGTPFEVVKSMMLPVIVPFNAIKGGLNLILTFLVIFPIRKFLHKNTGTM